jgi:hypothetical protein
VKDTGSHFGGSVLRRIPSFRVTKLTLGIGRVPAAFSTAGLPGPLGMGVSKQGSSGSTQNRLTVAGTLAEAINFGTSDPLTYYELQTVVGLCV